MATKQKEVTTFDVQVAEFIRNHKQAGTAVDDEINDALIIPFTLDADGIEDLLQRIQDAGISITDKEGNPSARVLNTEEEEAELTDEELLGSNSAKVNDPVRMYLKEIGVVPLLTNEEEQFISFFIILVHHPYPHTIDFFKLIKSKIINLLLEPVSEIFEIINHNEIIIYFSTVIISVKIPGNQINIMVVSMLTFSLVDF